MSQLGCSRGLLDDRGSWSSKTRGQHRKPKKLKVEGYVSWSCRSFGEEQRSAASSDRSRCQEEREIALLAPGAYYLLPLLLTASRIPVVHENDCIPLIPVPVDSQALRTFRGTKPTTMIFPFGMSGARRGTA